MSTLDFIAAHAVARARLLERAVHDPGPWQIEIGGVRADAVRVRTPRRVLFLANFDDIPEGEDVSVAWLLCRGEMVSSRDVPANPTRQFSFEWSILGPDIPDPEASAFA